MVRLTWWSRFSKAKRADYEEISQAHKKARFEKNPEKYTDPNAPPEINESKLKLLLEWFYTSIQIRIYYFDCVVVEAKLKLEM